MRVHLFYRFIMGASVALALSFVLSSGILVAEETNNSYLTSYSFAEEAAATPAQPSVAPSTCQSNCQSNCGDPCCGPKWVFGAEAVWLAPIRGDRDLTFQTARSDVAVDQFYPDAKADGLVATPRVWLGIQGEKWGLVTRYWRMEEGTSIYTPGNAFSSYIASDCFKAETFDIELTRRACLRGWDTVVSGGLRYAELDQRTNLSVVDALAETDILSGSAYVRNHFGGVGFTGALQGIKPINDCGLNLFYVARGSWLVNGADAVNTVETSATYGGGSGFATSRNGAATTGCDGNLFIGELQLGTQWNFALCERCNDAFFRIALEYQYWDTGDTGSAASISTASGGATSAAAEALSGNTHLSLVGFLLGAGFNY